MVRCIWRSLEGLRKTVIWERLSGSSGEVAVPPPSISASLALGVLFLLVLELLEDKVMSVPKSASQQPLPLHWRCSRMDGVVWVWGPAGKGGRQMRRGC